MIMVGGGDSVETMKQQGASQRSCIGTGAGHAMITVTDDEA